MCEYLNGILVSVDIICLSSSSAAAALNMISGMEKRLNRLISGFGNLYKGDMNTNFYVIQFFLFFYEFVFLVLNDYDFIFIWFFNFL